MGFRPMVEIDKTTISVGGDSGTQNATIDSLRNYQYGKKKRD